MKSEKKRREIYSRDREQELYTEKKVGERQKRSMRKVQRQGDR